MEWTGWVQSRIRRLVYNLSHAAEVRLWPIEYTPEIDPEQPHQVWFWIGVKRPHFIPNRQRNGAPLVDMGHPIKEFRFSIKNRFRFTKDIFRYQVYHNYTHHKPGMNMQVIECKPAFVPEELFVSGKNPHKDAAGKSSPSDDTCVTTDVEFQSRHQSQDTAASLPTLPSSSNPSSEAIPGLESHE